MIRVGVIGYGYWGPGIVRNFHGVEGCEVAMVATKARRRCKRAKQAYPELGGHHRPLRHSAPPTLTRSR